MLWFRELGSKIEERMGGLRLLLMVALFAFASNLTQYFLIGGGVPNSSVEFGGMSGVNYALLGFIWSRGKLDPRSGLFVQPWTIGMMGIWFFACLIGFLGPAVIASNISGLVFGAAWGFLFNLRQRLVDSRKRRTQVVAQI